MIDLSVIIFVAVGFLVHSIMFLGPIDRSVLSKLILAIFGGMVFGFLTCAECTSKQEFLVGSTMFYFLFYFAIFRKDVLPRCNELSLIMFTLLFWYTFLLIAHEDFPRYLVIIPATVTLVVIYQLFSGKEPGRRVKVFLYLWQLAVIIWLYFFLLVPEFIIIDYLNYLESFIYGMMMYYLAIHLFPLLMIFSALPYSYILSKFKIYLWDRSLIFDMAEKYSAKQLHVLPGILSISAIVAVLYFNNRHGLFSEAAMINLFLIFLIGNNALEKISFKKDLSKQC